MLCVRTRDGIQAGSRTFLAEPSATPDYKWQVTGEGGGGGGASKGAGM